jgi:hypothetical protein
MLSSLWPFCASAASLQQSSPSGCNPLGQSITCLCWGHPFPAAIRSEDPRQVGQSYGSCDRKDLERLHRHLPSGEQIRQTRRRCLSSRQPRPRAIARRLRNCAAARRDWRSSLWRTGAPAVSAGNYQLSTRRSPQKSWRCDGGGTPRTAGAAALTRCRLVKSRWEGDARLRTMNPCLALPS